jgi:aspartyl-tRNA(Asn)/glutamyl-tRNA(Gln) amidotransferase subunit A
VTDLGDLGVLEADALLRAGEVSAVELVQACLARIEQRNGGPPSFDGATDRINAWARVYPERARDQALAAARRRARERDDAPILCGIPLALKDLYAVRGLPLTASSRVLADNVEQRDASAWSRLRDCGMVLLGHTHTHEFAAGGTTDQVGNPWALDRVAGGSSGGSAAALAAGMTPAALGTDTCGSLRIPSACCGTSTIKPTHGRVALDGVIPLAPTLDHAGPMARCMADCSVLLGAMAGRPPASMPVAPRRGPRPLAGLRIAVSERVHTLEVDSAVLAEFDRALSACRTLGATLLAPRVPAPLDWDDLSTVLLSEAWAYHARHRAARERYRPAIAEFVDAASTFTDAQRYIAAQQRRMQLTCAWEQWFSAHAVDLLVEPTLPVRPGLRGPGYDRGHAGGAGDPMIALTALWDMTGMPVASIPLVWDVGLSLVAPHDHEPAAVQAAIDLQEHALGVPAYSAPLGAQSPQRARV